MKKAIDSSQRSIRIITRDSPATLVGVQTRRISILAAFGKAPGIVHRGRRANTAGNVAGVRSYEKVNNDSNLRPGGVITIDFPIMLRSPTR